MYSRIQYTHTGLFLCWIQQDESQSASFPLKHMGNDLFYLLTGKWASQWIWTHDPKWTLQYSVSIKCQTDVSVFTSCSLSASESSQHGAAHPMLIYDTSIHMKNSCFSHKYLLNPQFWDQIQSQMPNQISAPSICCLWRKVRGRLGWRARSHPRMLHPSLG